MRALSQLAILAGIFLTGYFLYFELQKEEETRQVSSLKIELSSARKALAQHCREMTEQLAEQGIANSFSEIVYNLHEPSLENEPILKDLPKCFAKETASPRIAEVSIFSSSSQGEAVGDIQFQVSVLDRQTRNKLAEAAFYLGEKK